MMSQILYPFLLLIYFFFFFHCATPKSHDQLLRDHSLSIDDFITSPDNSFTCGFLNLDNSNAYWFAIWFTDSKHKTVVWTANRDHPVNSRGSEVRIQRDGTMILTDVNDDTIVWQTNTTTTHAVIAKLLDSGNLVLENSQGHVLWQSFDFPTDTLLPLQTLTKNKRLTSSLRKGRFESGYFNLYFDSNNILILISDKPDSSSIYWPDLDLTVYQNGRTNYNSSRVASLDEFGRFSSSDKLQINASDMGYGTKRRMTIDYDGNLRIYSLVSSTGLWNITWQALAQPCSVRGLCGRNALCVWKAPSGAQCACLPGFKNNDPSDWNAGCEPMFTKSLLRTQPVRFLEIPHVDFYGFDFDSTSPVTFEFCRQMCVNDSRCLAFSYTLSGEGKCFVKSELLNGYEGPAFHRSIYIKIPSNVPPSNPSILYESNKMCGTGKAEQVLGSARMYDLTEKRVKWTYIYSFCAALGAIEVILYVFGWWFLFRKHDIPASIEAGYRTISSNFKRYTYAELKEVTKNFNCELGRGGSGVVYKGVLSDGREVAVKKLDDVSQAQDEYSAEINTIGKINHMNLVRMWGFCSQRRHRLLVYEYVENLSLDKLLFDRNAVLTWKQRFAIAIGTAKGLAYLHHECLEWVIHCDVKPENILLDGEFQPKIADFGLARLSQRGNSGLEFSKIRGTKGYLAPEWALNHPITAKVDVYGYGIVILEMVRGIRLSNWEVEDEYPDESPLASFVKTVKNKIGSGNSSWVKRFVDLRLNGKFSRNEAKTLVEIGISCVEEDKNKRPTMAFVVQTLLEFEEN